MGSKTIQHPSGVFLCLGDEAFSLTQRVDEIRRHFVALGYEREQQTVTARFDWSILASAHQTLSLFSEKRLVEGRLDSCKLDKKAIEAIASFVAAKDENTVLLLWSLDFDMAILKAKWFQQLKASIGVELFRPAKGAAFIQWLMQREKSYQISLSSEQREQMALHFEGNALAAEQCFKQLAILSEGSVSTENFEQVLTLQLRLDVFEMTDAALAGNTLKALNGLTQCQATGMAGLAVLDPMMYQLRQLMTLSEALASGQAPAAACQTAGIWSSKQSLFLEAARRLPTGKLPLLLTAAAKAERAFKSSDLTTGWTLLSDLVMFVGGNGTLLEASLCTSAY